MTTPSTLQGIIPNDGACVLVSVSRNGGHTNHVCTIDQIDAKVANNKNTNTLYYSIAAFKDGTVAKYQGRAESNVKSVKTFIVDLDVKDEGYSTREIALAELYRVCSMANLPRPTLISSGGGFHAYWPMNRSLNVITWRKISTRLVAVLNHHGLKYDTGLTKNPVVLLRPPGSVHRKDPNNPQIVEVWEDNGQHNVVDFVTNLNNQVEIHNLNVSTDVRRITGGLPAGVPALPTITNTNLSEDDGGFSTIQGPKGDGQKVFDNCQQIRESADSKNWRLMLTIMRLVDEGENWCHKVSAMGDYDSNAVDKKLNAMDKLPDMPATCATLNDYEPGICQGCKHWGTIKSPIVLGNIQSIKVVVEPVQPAVEHTVPTVDHVQGTALQHPRVIPAAPEVINFEDKRFIMDETGIRMPVTDDDGNVKVEQICKQRMFPLSTITTIDNAGNKIYSYLWRVYSTDKAYFDYIIPASKLHSRDGLVNLFAEYGVIVELSRNWGNFGMVTRAMAVQIRTCKEEQQMHSHMGWTQDMSAFVHSNELMIKPSVGVVRAPFTPQLKSYTSGRTTMMGDIQPWKDAASIFCRAGNECQAFCLGVAFGAPLMQFTQQRGALIHMDGATGHGKSTLQEVIAAVWGSPKTMLAKAVGVKSGDTLLSFIKKVGYDRNLPVMLEEITNMASEDVSDFIYALSLGAEKSRLKGADHKFDGGGEWSTLFLSSGNGSMLNKLAMAKPHDHAAEAARMMEITLPPVARNSTFQMDAVTLSKVAHNYGNAGQVYASYLMENKDILQSMMDETIAQVQLAVNAQQEERFYVASVSCVLLGLKIAKFAGLINPDLHKVAEFAYSQFKTSRGEMTMAYGNNVSLFADMMNTLLKEIVITQTGEMTGKETVIQSPTGNALSGRVELGSAMMYLSATAMKDYCRSKGLALTAVLQDAESNARSDKHGSKVLRTLGKGVPGLSGTGQTWCYMFDLNDDTRTKIEEASEQ